MLLINRFFDNLIWMKRTSRRQKGKKFPPKWGKAALRERLEESWRKKY